MATTLDAVRGHAGGPVSPTADPAPPGAARRSGREWVALAVLLAGTGALYLWNLGASGWANSFYAAAVQAGTQSWTAFFFGSLDPSNAITVDKPPASLWPMEIAGRIFGFSSWSMLVPQALMGVGAVALLYAAVRRVAGPGAGLLAGAVLALTPVAALMFRFNNPDALLVLLMVAAAYATTRAVEKGDRAAGTRWLLLAGLVIGFAFLAKSLQAFLVLPGLTLAYLWAAPGSVRRRITQVLGAGVAIVVGAGWWLLAVALWPVSSRPYIGGSTDNTPLELAFGYNGLGRIFGESRGGSGAPGTGGAAGAAGQAGGAAGQAADAAGQAAGAAGRTAGAAGQAVGAAPGGMPGAGGLGGMAGGPGGMPGGGGAMFGGEPGLLRMFTSAFGTQVSWLLPAALVLLVAAIWLTRRAPRTDRTRAGLLLWGGWTVVTAATFSFMSGIIHPYYTVALAPGIAALVGIGGAILLRHRSARRSTEARSADAPGTGSADAVLARVVLAVVTAGTAVWAFVMLGWSAEFLPWLRWPVLVIGVLAGLAFLIPSGRRRWAAVVVGAAVLAGIAAPTAYAAQTAVTAHNGSIPTAGPVVAGADGGPGGIRGDRRDRAGQAPDGQAGQLPDGAGATAPGSTTPGSTTPGRTAPGSTAPGRTAPGRTAPGGTAPGGTASSGTAPGTATGGSTIPGSGMSGGMGGGMGGPGGETTSAELVTLLQQAGTRWSAATIGSQGAASMQLASGDGVAVMAIGGFSGSDAYPTLEQFQSYVHDGQIRYFVNGGGGGGPGGDRGVGAQITQWVSEHYTATTVGNRTVYDLSSPAR